MKKIFVQDWKESNVSFENSSVNSALLDPRSAEASTYRTLIDLKSSAFLASDSGGDDFKFDHAIVFEHLKYTNVFSSMMNTQSSEAAISGDSGPSGLQQDHAIVFRREKSNLFKSFISRKLSGLKSASAEHPRHLDTTIGKSVRDGILVVHDFLSKETCKLLVDYAATQKSVSARVVDLKNSDEEVIRSKSDKARITEIAQVDGKACEVLNIFNDIFCRRLAAFYNVDFEWYERPAILIYPPGGRYNVHSDTGRWNPQKKIWERTLDRDYSVLLYLNEEFEGGEIEFARQKFKIKPETGMLIAFPSDHRYKHAALPVKSGIRYAIVSWAVIMGSERARKRIPAEAVCLSQRRSAKGSITDQ